MTTASKATWLTAYLEAWAAGAGTAVAALPAARAAKTFRALETAFGREDVLARWRTAWAITPDHQRKFLTPESFSRRYGEFKPPTLDLFGFVLYAPEQDALASEIVEALGGARSRLYDRYSFPPTFPFAAALLRAYESLRGYHERGLQEYGDVISTQRTIEHVWRSDSLLSHMSGV
jgi:hypothetical protein